MTLYTSFVQQLSLYNYLELGIVYASFGLRRNFYGHLLKSYPVTRAIALPSVIGLVKLAVLDHRVIHSGTFSVPSLDNLVSFYG